jgi:hypothetical protein
MFDDQKADKWNSLKEQLDALMHEAEVLEDMTARSQKEELASQIRQKINVGASATSSAKYTAPSLRRMASR